MDSARLAQAFSFIKDQGLNLHSLLVIRNGHLVVEAYFSSYHANTRHVLYSCTKSFIATLVGIAMDQGSLTSVDQPVLDFFPDQDFANPGPHKSALTLEHLLTMTSGLKWTENDIYPLYSNRDWIHFMLDRPLETAPGDQFNYCSGCSHLLAAILQQATGTQLLDFARANLFAPLGITDLVWETDPAGLPIGGWGLEMTPRDMAKLGYLYLNDGAWDGKQIVSASWVQRAVAKHITTGGDLDYGYQWWVDPAGRAYAALGLNGQTIFAVPEDNCWL
jgi:CubicO group peptidase (beta-lactamase class C family)